MRPVKMFVIVGTLLTLLVSLTGFGTAQEATQPTGETLNVPSRPYGPNFVDPESVLYNIPVDLPVGSRIDYLRILYFDTSPYTSTAFITTYDGIGHFDDLVSVQSSGQGGFGYKVSGIISQTVDNLNHSYVLNWRPNLLGNTMRLCGLRVAYRLPTPTGFDVNFSYKFVAGAAMRPRDASPWAYGGTGCVYTPYRIFLPFSKK